MSVRTNADTPEQTQNAIAFGAVGIGLCRTEHMFFEGDRIDAMREMILAETLEDAEGGARQAAAVSARRLRRHLPRAQGISRRRSASSIRRCTSSCRTRRNSRRISAKKLGIPAEKIHLRVEQLHEFNPMLGLRGCRLGIDFPEISEMQARAVFEAAAIVQKEGIKVRPEVMIPLVGFKKEFDLQLEIVHRVAKEVQAERKVKLSYLVGTMIEIPRGALTADEIAQTAEFFSFGTNDLTQTGLGMSRDDSGSFLPHYAELEIVKKNPFATIDHDRRRPAGRDRREEGTGDAPEDQARHLRRARRRPDSIHVLREGRPRLRQRVAVPRAGRAPRGCAGGDREGNGVESGLAGRPPEGRTLRMNTIFVHRDGRTEPVTSIDRSWLSPARGRCIIWVDLAAPSIPESLVLSETFSFHHLAVEDARLTRHSPKIDAYDDYLFAGRRRP